MTSLLLLVLEVYKWILIAACIVTWVPNLSRRNPVVSLLFDLTEPVLRPLRRLIPPEKTGYLDLSPLIAFFIINIIQTVIARMPVAVPLR